MKMKNRTMLTAVSAVVGAMALGTGAASAGTEARPAAESSPAQASSLYTYCYATRGQTTAGARGTYYFSRVFGSNNEPATNFNVQFQSFVSDRYSSRGGFAQCLRYDGRQEAERQMNNTVVDARAGGNEVVFTDWQPR
jgi:ABC-type glycerol-3-phosphate transport system substrate-binding protein